MAQQEATGRYTFRATVGSETVLFSKRPVRKAGTIATHAFVEKFEKELFVTSYPNAAIIFTTGNKESTTTASAAVYCGAVATYYVRP